MMDIFGYRKKATTSAQTTHAKLSEEIQELSIRKNKEVDRARVDAESAINKATRADIKGLTLLEKGRCPECGGRTETYLFSNVCPSCGWFRRNPGDKGRCIVYLDDGDKITCDRVFNARGGLLLCIRENMIFAQIARRCVCRVDFDMNEDELREAWEKHRKESKGSCSWCENALSETTESEMPIEEYVAFGFNQERHVFCSDKCITAFRKQYPVRIHRNCYETNCNDCAKCNKRFETTGFVRKTL